MCYNPYEKKSNAVFCSNNKCANIMCTCCFVRDFLRNLALSNRYTFIHAIPCCTCQVVGAFEVDKWLSTMKSPNFHTMMKDIAAEHLTVLQKELARISAELFQNRHDLIGIINSSCEEPFSPDDQDLIQKFCDFMKKYAGHPYSQSVWATEMKYTARAF